ncbi:ABC transporter ATP-binding protein [Azospirillum agricola]|uniref:ABC transporter ATP-binding protein n=1 Tax=Azospirillum agricola TaxID=1720247 RepID=UPI000A0F3CDB|nr:ABC transporter ATP-binding protein [Azospirillum agricola]SMH44115.1 peptide/nickel transport system ATP-binding protein [Azospirillum lipoferum]
MLRVENLSIRFRRSASPRPAVSGVSFSVGAGQSVALVGESGSGKTLTCRSILGILPRGAEVCGGSVRFGCKKAGEVDLLTLSRSGLRAIRGSQISMIFQEPMSALSPLHTIGAQTAEVLRLHGNASRSQARAECLAMFERVGFPDPERAYRSYPFQLSGGLRQRAMIAMAMVARPRLLIADEPTTALDVTLQAQVLALIKTLQAETGMAVLMVTHDLGVVANMADAVVVLRAGRVMESGACADVLGRPLHGYTRKLMAAAPMIPDYPEVAPEAAVSPTDAATAPVDAILEFHGVAKTFERGASRVKALAGIDLRVRRGETLAIVGESGSGKTTLARLAMLADRPDPGGRILFRPATGAEAVDLSAQPPSALLDYRRRAQMVFQDPYASLSPRMTVGSIIGEPLTIHGVCDAGERHRRVRALMARVGLDPAWATRYPHAFSGGQRQRIGIARALALDPMLLICDEPTSALDVSVQAQVLDLLESIKERLGLSLMFISHDLAVVARLADRVVVMRAGQVVEQAPPAVLFSAPVHPYTQALIAASPEPDVNRPIDIRKVALGAGAPDLWPAAFRPAPDGPPPLVEVAPGHFVRRAA